MIVSLPDREVADLVHHEQRRMCQHSQAPGEVARSLGFGERVDQPG